MAYPLIINHTNVIHEIMYVKFLSLLVDFRTQAALLQSWQQIYMYGRMTIVQRYKEFRPYPNVKCG